MTRLRINGKTYDIQVEPHWTLLDVLRDKLVLMGTKKGCDRGACGTCTILMDGQAVLSCMILAIEAEDKSLITIEGLAQNGKLHPIQQAFIEHDGFQCGYCTPAQILTAKALLDENPNPTEREVREALSGILCRCGAYPKIVKSVLAAADKMRRQKDE